MVRVDCPYCHERHYETDMLDDGDDNRAKCLACGKEFVISVSGQKLEGTNAK